ncbi:MAG: RNA pseudouridine synthase, partial [Clostridia bacterium]|nr:RNA pseudouridine synthase [Clostridia bacterium]
MQQYRLTPTAEQTNKRLDSFLAEELPLTRSAAQNLLESGLVMVNGKTIAKNYRLRGGEEVLVSVPDATPCEAQAQEIPLDIVYEDRDLLVVNKPKGMVVHPAAGHADGTLVNALLAHCGDSLSGINGVMRPGIVHRIDKDTSGLLIVAKNDEAHQGLAEQIKVHSFTRIYEAVVIGHRPASAGTVNAPIGRHP